MSTKVVIGIAAALILVGGGAWFFHYASQKTGTHKFDEPSDIASAAIGYREEYGAFPIGTYHEVCRALSGENPREISFIHSADRIGLDEQGGFLDSWNRPYTIFFTDKAVLVRSRGKDGLVDDGQFYEADDILVSRSIDETENTWHGRENDG